MSNEHIVKKLRGSATEANEAFAYVYDCYADRVYAYCRRMLRSDLRSLDDVCQNVFVHFFDVVRRGKDVQNIGAYLLRSARNQCINEQQRLQRISHEFLDEEHGRFDRGMEQHQLLEIIQQALELLPEDLRSVFVMREELELSYEEIAETLNCTQGTVRNKVWRAKQQMREMLAPYLHETQDGMRQNNDDILLIPRKNDDE